jgi:hypothetical protein
MCLSAYFLLAVYGERGFSLHEAELRFPLTSTVTARSICSLTFYTRGSSIMSGYGLDDRAIEVRSPEKDFSSNLCVRTGSEAHPASCPMATGGPFSGGKARLGSDADHSPHLVPTSLMSRSYTSSPPAPPHVCCGTAFTFLESICLHSMFNVQRKDSYRQRMSHCCSSVSERNF